MENTHEKVLLTDSYAIINLESYCKSEKELFQSDSFELVLNKYLSILSKNDSYLIKTISQISSFSILTAYKLLTEYSFEDCKEKLPEAFELFKNPNIFFELTDGLYSFWRKIKKYGTLLQKNHDSFNNDSAVLIKSSDDLNNLVNNLYINITSKILQTNINVYRQVSSSIDASFLLTDNNWNISKTYDKISNTKFISNILLRPPFMVYSKSNIRVGMFTETFKNPIENIKYNSDDFLVYPVKVGPCIAYVYFHKDYTHHGVSLCNLFETISQDDFKNKKPDLIYIYGINEEEFDGKYYLDQENDIYIGTVTLNDKNDYFGYMKKMLLTLHNIYMIDKNKLPIHGAMVNLLLNDNSEKNIIIIGDSGAGKSETLEALRVIGNGFIKNMRTIYDDMGTLCMHNNELVSFGTEIGAFIRIDDLDSGYAYQEIDRAIFLNPNKKNARIILPVSTYQYIIKNHKVDYVLYANNYKETDEGMRFFASLEDALPVFKSGRRLAKGTTHEVGLVESYFANPFGPKQRREKCDILLNDIFKKLFDSNIPVGELYTRLAINGFETKGPQTAAAKLLEFLSK